MKKWLNNGKGVKLADFALVFLTETRFEATEVWKKTM